MSSDDIGHVSNVLVGHMIPPYSLIYLINLIGTTVVAYNDAQYFNFYIGKEVGILVTEILKQDNPYFYGIHQTCIEMYLTRLQ